MSTYTDVNTIRNSLVALQVLALSNADEYLENLAEKGLEALDRLAKEPDEQDKKEKE